MSIENRIVESNGRFVIVTIDVRAVQVSTPDPTGGRFYVNGYNATAIESCASWAARHGRSFKSRAAAEATL